MLRADFLRNSRRFALGVGALRPVVVAVLFEARDDVEMRMEDDLPCRLFVIHRDINAARRNRPLYGAGYFLHCPHYGGEGVVVHIVEVLRVFFRDDKRVSGVIRMNIKKGERVFILIHFVRGDFSPHDFAEYALLHAPSVYRNATMS